MPEKYVELNVLNPRGKIARVPRIPASPRLKTLEGKKIGVVKFGVWGIAEKLWPRVEEALKIRVKNIQFRQWPLVPGGTVTREARLKEIAEYSDGVVVMLGMTGTSSARTVLEAIALERLGKPVAYAVTRPFQANARFVSAREGLPDISLVVVPLDALPHLGEIEELGIADSFADGIIKALTQTPRIEPDETIGETLVFRGVDYADAVGAMEKFFLQHGWSDGLPLVPPTPEAVSAMCEGTDLPQDYLVGRVEPGGGEATVQKIAINAVMAGCLPQYLPVVIAAVEAITDPKFDLREVQCTSCNMSPFFIISGMKLIEELNINSGFSTIGPGWRANATIGRAVRLIMTNLGHTWPGVNDMKTLGSPFRYITLMAENEMAYKGAWEPLRVAEGFPMDQPTISVMPAMSWQPDIVQPEPPTVKRIIEYISKQGKVKHDRLVGNWGMDNLVLLCASTFDCIRREGYSRADIQKALFEAITIPAAEFLGGRDIQEFAAFGRLPKWLIEKCQAGPDVLVPLLAGPEHIKICVAGGAGPYGITYTSTFGYGPAHFVTKPIKLPKNWGSLLEKYRGWESPLVR
ncbi:MAG: hypothetical protein ONB05_06295 [candidate division KSB1 bacterium]|nr:hypothetical protein [candidate division KSB1 bacterium]